MLVLASSWTVLRESVAILLEETPRGIDAEEVGGRMAALPGVTEVHDLHIWTITSGFPALSAHVLVGPEEDCHARRAELQQMLEKEYDIHHSTLQVDHATPALQQIGVGRFSPSLHENSGNMSGEHSAER